MRNPATGDVIANVPKMGKKETSDAISSAYNTFSCMNPANLILSGLSVFLRYTEVHPSSFMR